MRSLVYVLLTIIVLHLLAAGAFVGYLAATDRLSTQRLEKVVEIFRPKISERKAAIAQAKAEAQNQAKQQKRAMRLQRAAQGPRTLKDRLDQQQTNHELTAQRIQRLEREKQDILRQVTQAKDAVAKQREQIKAARDSFDKRLKDFKTKQAKKDFKHAVALIEQLQPGKAKRLFQDMLAQGKESTVIGYLAAMAKRKAGKILGQFETPEEITQARSLIEGLRKRGAEIAEQPLRVNQNRPPQSEAAKAEDAAA